MFQAQYVGPDVSLIEMYPNLILFQPRFPLYEGLALFRQFHLYSYFSHSKVIKL